MRLPRNAKIFRGQLDAAPFIGVFFLVTIFLMVHSRLAFTPGVKIELPEAGRDLPGINNPLIVVAIDANGQIYYDNQVVREEAKLLQQLKTAVEKSSEPMTLVIQADKAARIEVVTRLIALAPELGFKEVSLPTRRGSPAIKLGAGKIP